MHIKYDISLANMFKLDQRSIMSEWNTFCRVQQANVTSRERKSTKWVGAVHCDIESYSKLQKKETEGGKGVGGERERRSQHLKQMTSKHKNYT